MDKESSKEKSLRGELKSQVHKLISKDDVVILDSLNYIKGIHIAAARFRLNHLELFQMCSFTVPIRLQI